MTTNKKKTIYFPPSLEEEIARRAESSGRSFNAEVIHCLLSIYLPNPYLDYASWWAEEMKGGNNISLTWRDTDE